MSQPLTQAKMPCDCGETTVEDCATRPERHCGRWVAAHEPRGGFHPVSVGDLREVEINTIRTLVDVLESLQEAAKRTRQGLVSDHCENAAREVRAAIRLAGG